MKYTYTEKKSLSKLKIIIMKNVIILFALILGNFGLAQQKESSLEHTLSINQNGAL
ncbi:heme-binding protein, partial [Riemerella anatipestifer]|nr:heme-binding protein [Riemerella anatipestifer]MDD1549918.1 heme-binding protein [Riemerella anatipestifer]MDD1551982.1 heme-binding protein [Riemerella anatipestifer]MDD1554022.1 heme-binding protein [Riemerella anatipestifer]MDD1596906.1 heme-binding protein [Riemerella anatipestifer]